MNAETQFKIDVEHFNVSFAPVIAKNRSAKDHYFCAVISARQAGISDLSEADLNQQQKILNQQSGVLSEYSQDYWDNQILRSYDD